jgi:hypothetical protein
MSIISTIDFVTFPAAVRVEVNSVPIVVRLSPDLFATPAAMALDGQQSSDGVDLIRENGVVYYEILNPAQRTLRYYVKLPPVGAAANLQPPPQSGGKNLMLRMGAVRSKRIAISVDGSTAAPVTTRPSLAFSDDFGGITYNRALWTLGGTPGSQANIGVAGSLLTLTNPATPSVVTELRSDRIDGHELAEVRDAVESARVADAGYVLEFNYTSEMDPLPALPSLARIGFNVVPSTGLVKVAPDPTTTITFNACHAGIWGVDQAVVLPALGVTTAPHNYAVAFDGHHLHLLVDGVSVAVRTVRIPHSDHTTLEIRLRGVTGAAPGGVVTFRTDRVDVVTDLPLAVTAPTPLAVDMSGAVIPPPVGMALEVTQLQVLAHAAQIDTTTLAILYAILHGGSAPAGHLLINFSWANVPTSPKLIGTVPAGTVVHVVAMIILAAFDQPVTLEVGRLAAPAELMLGTDNNPTMVDTYHTQPDQLYAAATDVYLTLIAGGPLPTTGTGQVIVYLD